MKTIITLTPTLSISLVTERGIETRVYLVVGGVEVFHAIYDHPYEGALEGHLEAVRRYYAAEVQARIIKNFRERAVMSTVR